MLPCCLITAQSCKPPHRGNITAALDVKYSSLSLNDIYLWEGESMTWLTTLPKAHSVSPPAQTDGQPCVSLSSVDSPGPRHPGCSS